MTSIAFVEFGGSLKAGHATQSQWLYGSSMSLIAYWIQHSDFTAEDFPPVDAAGALRAFREHDWAAELRRQDTRAANGEDNCPAGIGLVSAGRLLHICPTDEDYALVHYHFTKERRLFGFFPKTVETIRSNLRFPLRNVADLLDRFYRDDHEWLSRHVR